MELELDDFGFEVFFVATENGTNDHDKDENDEGNDTDEEEFGM